MKYLALGCVVLALCLVGVLGIKTDFEDGTTGSWYVPNDYYTFTAVDGGAASTTKAGRLQGGAGLNRDGPVLRFDAFTPSTISFYVKAGVVGNVGGVTFGFGNDSSSTAIEFRFLDTGLMGIMSSTNTPVATQTYTVDQWYNIRLEISWDNLRYDYYVDNILRQYNNAFKNGGVSQINSMYFFNSGTGSTQISYIDQIYVGCLNDCSNQTCDAVSGSCLCMPGFCGVDCSIVSTTLTRNTPVTATTTTGNYYVFSPNDVGFSFTIKSINAYYVYYKTLGTAVCAGDNSVSSVTSFSAANTYGFVTYNITQCDMFTNYPTGTSWSFAVLPTTPGNSVTYTIQIINDMSILTNNRKTEASANKFTFKVPETTNPTNSLTFTMESNTYGRWYGGNYTNACVPTYSGKVQSTLTNAYTYTVANTVPGSLWSWSAAEFYSIKSITPVLSDCERFCSNGGVCLNNKCDCPAGFTGETCSNRECPSNCNGQGTCNAVDGTCSCNAGYAGVSCGCAAPLLTTRVNGTSYAYTSFNNYFSVNAMDYPVGFDIVASSTTTVSSPLLYYGVQCSSSSSDYIDYSSPLSFDACDVTVHPKLIIAPLYYSSSIIQYSLTLTPRVLPALVNLQPYLVASVSGVRYYSYDATGGAGTKLEFTVVYGTSHVINAIYVGTVPCIEPGNSASYVATASGSTTSGLRVSVTTPETRRYYILVDSYYTTSTTVTVANSNCANTCNGNGLCVNNACVCAKNYAGASCETFYDCSNLEDCNNQGTCGVGNKCTCYPGYAGAECGCSISKIINNGATVDALSTYSQTRVQLNTSAYPDGATVTITPPITASYFYLDASTSRNTCPSSSSGSTFVTGTYKMTPQCSSGASTNPIVSIYPSSSSSTGTYSFAITPFNAKLSANVATQLVMSGGASYYWIYDNEDSAGFVIYATALRSSCDFITTYFAVKFGECASVANATQRIPELLCSTVTTSNTYAATAAWGFRNARVGRYYIAWNAPQYSTYNASIVIRSYAAVSASNSVVPTLAIVLLPLLSMLYYLF